MMRRRDPIFLIGLLVGVASLAFLISVLSHQASYCAAANQQSSRTAPSSEHANAPEKQTSGGEHHIEKHPNRFQPVCGLVGFFPTMFAYFNDNEGATVGSATLLLVIATLLLWKKTDDVMVSAEESNKTATRAWVFAEPKMDGTTCGLFVKNYGKTPARVTEILLSYATHIPDEIPQVGEDYSVTLGVDDGQFLNPTVPPLVEGPRIAFGFVRYVDVFNETKISRFCFEMTQRGANVSVGGSHLRSFT